MVSEAEPLIAGFPFYPNANTLTPQIIPAAKKDYNYQYKNLYLNKVLRLKYICQSLLRISLLLNCVLYAQYITAQYVQTGPPIFDNTAPGSNLQASSVALSANGQIAVAGFTHRQHNSGGFNVYQRNGNQWNTIFSYTCLPGYEMGEAATLSGNGNTLIIGANPLYSIAFDSLWIFSRNGNVWEYQQKIACYWQPTISYDGNTLAAGGSIYQQHNGTWSLTYTFSNYGIIAVSGNGNTAAGKGTSSNPNQIYARNGNLWTPQASIIGVTVDNVTISSNYIEDNMILSGDGNTAGCYFSYHGQECLATYRRNGNTWTQDTSVIFNSSTGFLSNDGYTYTGFETLNTSTNEGPVNFRFNGHAWVRDSTTTGWNLQGYNTGQGGHCYCSLTSGYMAVDSSCTLALLNNSISDTTFGGVKQFNFNNNKWISNTPAFTSNEQPGNGEQGSGAIISADGNTMAFGGRKNNYGTVWIYTRNGFRWTQQAILQSPEGNTSDWLFGLPAPFSSDPVSYPYSLALSGNGNSLAIIAARAYVFDSTAQYYTSWGKVYLFKRSGTTWLYDTVLASNAPGGRYIIGDSSGFYGQSVAFSNDGTTLIVGTSNDGAYVYKNSGSQWAQQGHLYVSVGRGSTKVALTPGGDTAVITEEHYNNDQGAIHIFVRNGNTWSLSRCCLFPPSMLSYGATAFPAAMAVSANGQYIAASMIGSTGWFFIYSYATDSWTAPYAIANGSLSMWLSQAGDTLVQAYNNLNNGNGISYLYNIDMWVRSGTTWSEAYQLPAPYAKENFFNPSTSYITDGLTMSVSRNKKYIIYGAPNINYNTGGVYVYQQSNLKVSLTDSVATSCLTSANGALGITVTGGTPPITITWSTGAIGVDTISNLAPGTYTVSITDADSVQLVRQYTISAKSNMVTNYPRSTVPCMPGNAGTITANVTGGVAPYTYLWNTVPVQTNITASVLNDGTYIYTATDALGCTIVDSANIQFNTTSSAYWVDVTGTQTNCGNNGSAVAVFNGSTGYVTYNWSNGSHAANDTLLGAGIYIVTVTDALGCSATGNVSLGTYCENVIKGRVYYDVNNDCNYSQHTDVPAHNNVYAYNGSYYAYGNTDSAGNYQILLPDSGTFNVYIYNWGTCGFGLCSGQSYPKQAIFITTGDTTIIDFPIIDTAYDISASVTAPVFNPGFNGNVTVYYGDLKSQKVPNATLTLAYDSNMSVLNITPTANAIIDSVNRIITWHIDTVYPWNNNQFVKAYFLISDLAQGPSVPVVCNITAPGNDCNPQNNRSYIGIPFASAIDPNEKTSQLTDSTIQYAIYFQNVGSDSTHFVIVSDTLSPYLNPATVQTLATSSASYSFSLKGNGIVQWRFDPYFLPDSATDPANSKGYVMFTVNVMGGTTRGTHIRNTGYVYFDYNPPVITNTVNDILLQAPCPVIATTINDTICNGDSVGVAGHFYTTPGMYTDTLTSMFGCDSVVMLNLTIRQPVLVAINDTICAGDSMSVGGNNYTANGNYTDTLTAATGCDSIVTLNLTIDQLPVVTLSWDSMVELSELQPVGEWYNTQDTILCLDGFGMPFRLTGGSPVGGIYSGRGVSNNYLINTYYYSPPLDTITYTYTDSHSCSNSASDSFLVEACEGINEIDYNNAISLHPNPTTGQLIITTQNLTPQTISIYDDAGRLLTTTPFKPETDISALSGGVYFVEVKSREGVKRTRIVKM